MIFNSLLFFYIKTSNEAQEEVQDEAQGGEYNIKDFRGTEIKIIQYTIPDRPTSKNQKYKLSVLGLRIFN
jgi:hypothetical protein